MQPDDDDQRLAAQTRGASSVPSAQAARDISVLILLWRLSAESVEGRWMCMRCSHQDALLPQQADRQTARHPPERSRSPEKDGRSCAEIPAEPGISLQFTTQKGAGPRNARHHRADGNLK